MSGEKLDIEKKIQKNSRGFKPLAKSSQSKTFDFKIPPSIENIEKYSFKKLTGPMSTPIGHRVKQNQQFT